MGAVTASALIRADNRKLKGDLSKSRSLFRKTFGGISKGIKGSLGGAMGMVGAGGAAIGFAAIGKEVLDFEQAMTDIEVQGNASAKTMVALRSTIKDLSRDNAQGRGELAGLADELVNLQGAAGLSAENLRVLADASFAAGGEAKDFAGVALSFANSFGLIDPSDLAKGLDAYVTAGERGSIPMRNMTTMLQQNAASYAMFSGKGVEAAAGMAAVLQTLRKRSGPGNEAGTQLNALLEVFQNRVLALKSVGIEVKDSAGEFLSVFEILDQVASSGILKNDKALKLGFGDGGNAKKALLNLVDLRGEMEKNLASAIKGGEVQSNIAKRRQSDSFKIKKSINDTKEAIAETFTPDRIKAFAEVLQKASEVLKFMIDHAANFVAIWAAFKLAPLVAGFQSMAAAQAAQAASAKASVGFLGKMGSAVNLIGVGLVAWNVGKIADDFFGISDKIGKMALNSEVYENSLGTRKGSKKLKSQIDSRMSFGFTGPMASDSDILKSSKFLRGDALANGVIDKSGKVNREQAFLSAHDEDRNSARFVANQATGFKDSKTEALVSQAKNADLLLREVAGLRADAKSRGLSGEIKISFDENGSPHAFSKFNQNVRRSPQ